MLCRICKYTVTEANNYFCPKLRGYDICATGRKLLEKKTKKSNIKNEYQKKGTK